MQMRNEPDRSYATIHNERVLSASARNIFTAFEQPELLATWWGPAGFTNTSKQFEFSLGGRRVFGMHGPDGVDYPNECVFKEIQRDTKIVIEHVVGHWFMLTVTLTAQGNQTRLTWDQTLESAEVAAKLRPICDPANEQNLDRLEAVLTG
jgi:uncharacterized protein YndB with AHSA1/START domain